MCVCVRRYVRVSYTSHPAGTPCGFERLSCHTAWLPKAWAPGLFVCHLPVEPPGLLLFATSNGRCSLCARYVEDMPCRFVMARVTRGSVESHVYWVPSGPFHLYYSAIKVLFFPSIICFFITDPQMFLLLRYCRTKKSCTIVYERAKPSRRIAYFDLPRTPVRPSTVTVAIFGPS